MLSLYSRYQQWLLRTRFTRPLLFASISGGSLGFMSGLLPVYHPDLGLPFFVPVGVGCFTGLLSLAIAARRRQARASSLGCLVLSVPFWFLIYGVALQWTLALALAGPLVALTSMVLVAITVGPRWDQRWLVAIGSGVVLGGCFLLTLWAIAPQGVLSTAFLVLTLLSAAVGGLASEGLRRLLETYQAHRAPAVALEPDRQASAQIPSVLSRRTVVLGGGSVLALATSGAGVTWLARTLLVHYVPQLIYQGHQAAVWSLAWSPDGRRLASASQDGRIQVWNSHSGSSLLHLSGPPPTEFPNDPAEQREEVTWSPDGQLLAVTGVGQPVLLMSASTGVPLRTYADGGSVAWAPDGQHLASGAYPIKIWDTTTGHTVVTLADSDYGDLVAWSPDGRYLATAADVQTPIQIWDATTGSRLQTYLGHQMNITVLGWSPDGRVLASGDFAGLVHLWEPQTGHTLFTYQGHATSFGFVSSLAWAPDGQRIVSAGNGTPVQVWQAGTGEVQFAYRGHQDLVNVVAWSPDGTRIASGGNDQTVQIWLPG